MRNKFVRFTSIFLAIGMNAPLTAFAQEVQGSMKSIYKPFRDLQYYASSPEIFYETKNAASIGTILDTLAEGFHRIETIPSKYRSQPGFDQNIQRVTLLLDDAARRFREKKKDYSLWAIRTLPNACFACHVTYKVDSVYVDLTTPDSRLDPLSRAKFLLATRQFQKAREVLLQILHDPSKRLFHGESLRSLLLVHTRSAHDTDLAIKDLTDLTRVDAIGEEDKNDLAHWIEQLREWKSDEKPNKELVEIASEILSEKLGSGEDVPLLYATAMLHKALESNDLDDQSRRQALYMLGYGYSELQVFFADGWAELYLEECITRYGGTHEAKSALKIYKELLVQSFTGSMGTNIPGDVILKFDELRKKAFGIPSFDERV